MYSKLTKTFKLTLVLVFLSSCSLSFDDKPKDLEANIKSGACLTDVNNLFDEYIKGKSSESEIQKASKCITYSLEEFKRVKKGSGFHPLQLTNFLNKKVIGEDFISKKLTEEIMKIKVIFIGGKKDYVRKEDFKKLIELIEFVSDLAISNLDFIKIYRESLTEQEQRSLNIGHLNTAKTQVLKTAGKLAEWLAKSDTVYDFNSLEELIRQLRKVLNIHHVDGEVDITQDKIDDWIDFLKNYKSIHVAGNKDNIQSTDWKPLLNSAATYYTIYLDYKYFIAENSISYGDGIAALRAAVNSAIDVIYDSILAQEEKVLSFKKIEEFLLSAQKLNLILSDSLGDTKSVDISKHLMPVMKYIAHNTLQIPEQKNGFTRRGVSYLTNEFRIWSDTQKSLFDIKRYSVNKGSEEDYIKLVKELEREGHPTNKSVVYLLNYLPLKYTSLKLLPEHIMISPYRAKKLKFKDLSQANNLRALSRLLIMTTAKDAEDHRKLRQSNLSKANEFYLKLVPLVEGLSDNANLDEQLINKRFKEASIFTYSGKGYSENNGLNITQIVEEISILLSVLETKAYIRNNIGSERDVKSYISKNYTEVFRRLPEMVQHYQYFSLSRNDAALVKNRLANYYNRKKLEFFNAVWEMVEENNSASVTDSELTNFIAIVHYIESIFISYDQDINGILTEQDVMRSFPRFQKVLSDELKNRGYDDMSVGLQKSIFAYLAKEGKVPSSGLLTKGELKWWDIRYFDDDPEQFIKKPNAAAPDMSVGRVDIAKVFKFLHSSKD